MTERISEKKIRIVGVLLFVVVVLSFLVEGNVKELREDTRYLIVFQTKGEPRAGVIFSASAEKSEPINAFNLPPVYEKSFFEEAEKYDAERIIVLNSEALKQLSSKPYITYHDSKVLVENAVAWISGYSWVPSGIVKEEERKKLEVWELNSGLLGSWVDENAREMLTLKRSSDLGVFFDEYRKGNIIVYPKNTVLRILSLASLEKAF